MSRPGRSSLVMDGSEVKFRLEAERLDSKTPVHVDWVRFTCLLRNAPVLPVTHLFRLPYISDRQEPEYRAWAKKQLNDYENSQCSGQFASVLREVADCDFDAATQALELGGVVCNAFGTDYMVNPVVKKGHDFYKFRWSIERAGVECGWIGFLASGDSPRQQAQSKTIHANLYGMACTFAAAGWRDRLADIVESRAAVLTRCDLALDFFEGLPGGIKGIEADYNAGKLNVGGKLLKVNHLGDWSSFSKGGRSIYFGSKEAGKETNCYEKGDQLFGVGVSPWLRAELRYGNKLRVLPVDMLRRPADFFGGASDWHLHLLTVANASFVPEKVSTAKRLELETVEAECVRSMRWTLTTAAPSIAVAFEHLGVEEFLTFVMNQKLPSRLRKFKPVELAKSYIAAFGRLSQPEGCPPFVPA